MIDLLQQKDVVEKIKPFFSRSDIVADQFFYPDNLDNGRGVSVYAPNEEREKFVSSNVSQITPRMFQLYIWMANLSNYKENNKSFFFYDNEKVVLTDIKGMTNEEIEKNRDVLIKDGCHFKRERTMFQKIIGVMSGETKEFKNFNETLSSLTNEYKAYIQPKVKNNP